MSSQESSFSPADVQDIITPNHSGVQDIRDYIEMLTDDDPALSLERTNSEELGRLDMRFVGWMHTGDNVPMLSKAIADYNPHILILEGFGDKSADRRPKELIHNLLMFDVPFHIRIGQDYSEPVLRDNPDNTSERIYNEVKSHGSITVVRGMDATAEQAAALGLSTQHNPGAVMLADLEWNRRPISKLQQDFETAILLDSRRDRIRESIMIEDVSRISANLLEKLNGEVRVMVCFGATHTAIARYFQKRGISADLQFIDSKTQEPRKTTRFGGYHAAVREGNYKGEISNQKLQRFLVELLVDWNISTVRTLIGDNRPIAERIGEDKQIASDVASMHGDEIWREWNKIHSPYLITRGMKEKAASHFDRLVEHLIARALTGPDGTTISR